MFQVEWSVKKVMLTVFWDMKGPITIDFNEKDATVKQCFLLLNSPFLPNDPCIFPKSSLNPQSLAHEKSILDNASQELMFKSEEIILAKNSLILNVEVEHCGEKRNGEHSEMQTFLEGLNPNKGKQKFAMSHGLNRQETHRQNSNHIRRLRQSQMNEQNMLNKRNDNKIHLLCWRSRHNKNYGWDIIFAVNHSRMV